MKNEIRAKKQIMIKALNQKWRKTPENLVSQVFHGSVFLAHKVG